MTEPQSRGSAVAHDLDGFLGHERGGGGAAFLDRWKKRKPPEVRVLVHTKAPVAISVYQHPWPKVQTLERDGAEVTEVWSGTYNSWETEKLLERQYERDDEGERRVPPKLDPLAIMLEEVEKLMRDGSLAWDTLLFEFKGDDREYDKRLFAAAITNKAKKIWEDKSTTVAQKKAARKKGFPGPGDVWMTNMMAKCQYVLTVLDYDDPDGGIRVAKETTLVGDKMRKVIRDRRTSEGDDEGNPLLNPYVFKISHHPEAKQFQDRYDVVAIGKLPVSEEMLEVIREKDPPNLDRYTSPGDIVALRASMEDHYVGPEGLLDWDAIFEPAETALGIEQQSDAASGDGAADESEGDQAAPGESADGDEAPDAAEEPADETPDRVIVKRKGKGADQQCFAADGMALYGCEKCDAIMRDDETVCHNCGEDYGEETPTEPEPKPAPPPRRARGKGTSNGKATKGKTAAKGTATARAAKAGKDGVGF